MKKEKKKNRIILNLLLLILGGSTGFFIYNILLLHGIEDILRYLFVALLALVFVIYVLLSLTIRHKSVIKKVFFYLFLLILIVGQLTVGYYIGKFYSTIDKISKTTVTYSTNLVALKDSKITLTTLKNMKIGMINDSSSIDGYTISTEIINDNSLKTNNTVTEYEDYFTMLKDLYAKKLNAVFVPSNYVSMFESTDEFANIATDLSIVTTKSKELEKASTPTSTRSLTEPFTILVMGIDSIVSDIKNANSNGDSLMVVTFNPKTLNATVLSIPRDTYVPISCFPNQKKNKITHAGWQGESCMEKTIENFTGINIDYYVKVDFKGVVDLVNILDGITVDVPMTFCEQDSNRSFANQLCLKKGIQTLNGEQALALARHRHTLLTGDLQRGLNQQLVVQGIMSKIKTITNVNQFYNILSSTEKHMDTNLTTSQILSLYNVAKDIITNSLTSSDSIVSIQQLYLEGMSARIYDASIKLELYDYVYYPKSLDAITKEMKVNLGISNATLIKKFNFSINTPYEKAIIGKGVTGGATLDLVPSFTGKSKSFVETWASTRNIKVTTTYVDKDDSYTQDNVISQSIPAKTDVTTISALTISVANVKVVTPVLSEYSL